MGWMAWGSNTGVGKIFRSLFHAGPWAHSASSTVGSRSLPGVMRPVQGVNHPPPSGAEVKERVDLYLYSPSGSS